MFRNLICGAFLPLCLLLPAAAFTPSPDPTPAQKLRPESPDGRVLVIAHRGCWGEAPEVSVAAIHACEGFGVDGVEIDVQRTRDGALVLIHDDTVDRTTDGTGAVAQMSLAEIRQLRLRKGPGGPNVVLTDHRIPTLEEGLRAAKGKFIVHVDYKSASLGEIAAVVKKVGMEGQVTAWLRGLPDAATQPDPAIADAIALLPVIVDCAPGVAPCRSASPEALDAYARYRSIGYFLTYRATRDFVGRVAAVGRPARTRIATETLGPIDNLPQLARRGEWQALIDLGVSMILTDHPTDLAAFLKGANAPGVRAGL
jgi:glycerophosphoryl diester phosphodiesterase